MHLANPARVANRVLTNEKICVHILTQVGDRGEVVSDTDSFIEEVSEEVRRDRLFALMRKYGWIGVLAILLIVGGAAYNEWNKASKRAAAQLLGDNLLAAMGQDAPDARIKALAALKVQTADQQALVDMLGAAQAQGAKDNEAAAQILQKLLSNDQTPKAYRDLASLKLVLLKGADMPAAERRALLQGLAIAGNAFRLLAEEQLAMIDVEEGKSDEAISRLQQIVGDVDASAGLRSRVSQLIMVLGGKIEAS